MLDVALIFKTIGLAKALAEFIGIVESISQKINRLSQAEFEAGIRMLIDASQSENEQRHLLRNARICFYKAISLEKNERLACTYLGLALCHHHLGDNNLSQRALFNLLKVEIEGTEMVKEFLKSAVKENFYNLINPVRSVKKMIREINDFSEIVGSIFTGKTVNPTTPIEFQLLFDRIKKLEELKQSVYQYFQDSSITIPKEFLQK